ncbi:MAG: hypothetical protein AB7Q23_15990 [Hyphomonadaceae bacterium]
MTVHDPRLASIQIAHRTNLDVSSQLSGMFSAGSTTFHSTFSLHDLPLTHDGPEKEVLACPACGAAVFEIERSKGLLLTWSACDEQLRAWIEQKFKEEPKQRWLEPVVFVVLIAAVATLAFQVWRVWNFLGSGNTWSDLWSSTALSDVFVWGGFAGFVLFLGFPAIVILLGGGVKSALSEFESLKPETTMWIPLSTGAPIESHPGLMTFVCGLQEAAEAGDKVRASHAYCPDGREIEHGLGINRIAELRRAKVDWSFEYGRPHKCLEGPVQRA